MSTSVDLRDLAIDRGDTGRPRLRTRRQVVTRYVLPLLLVCGFLALVAGASWELVFPPQAVTVIPVVSATSVVQREGTPLFKAAGWIEPRPTAVRVAALAPGVIEELLVVQDQPVRAGESVAELVKADARLVCERAEADLHLREAELAESQATLQAAVTRFEQPVHLQAALGEAEAMLAKVDTELQNLPFEQRRAAADLKVAKQDHSGKSAASEAVSGIQIDIAKGKLDSAQALVDELDKRHESLAGVRKALVSRRDALRTQLELLADEIRARDEAEARRKAALARVEQARVSVAEAQLQLHRMTVRAPIDGRIFRLVATPGARIGGGNQMATSDGSTVVTMYDPAMLQVRVDIRFEDIPKVRLDQTVEIDNPALSVPITGRVLFISSEADIQKNTLQAKVEIPNPPEVFKPEMLVDVTFLAPREPQRATEPSQELKLFVPESLVRKDETGPFVWVADQSAGLARKVGVETGPPGNRGLVEIKRGLNLASRLIASGSERLTDGARIKVIGEDTALGDSKPARTGGSKSLPRLRTGEESHAPH